MKINRNVHIGFKRTRFLDSLFFVAYRQIAIIAIVENLIECNSTLFRSEKQKKNYMGFLFI